MYSSRASMACHRQSKAVANGLALSGECTEQARSSAPVLFQRVAAGSVGRTSTSSGASARLLGAHLPGLLSKVSANFNRVLGAQLWRLMTCKQLFLRSAAE